MVPRRRRRSSPTGRSVMGCRLVASNAGTSSCLQAKPLIDPVMSSAFRPLLAKDVHPSEFKRAKSPAPFCRELRLSGAQSKMQWEKDHHRRHHRALKATNDPSPRAGSDFPRPGEDRSSPAPRQQLSPNERSAGTDSPIPPPKLKNRTVSPLVSRICKEVLWNLIFTATGPP